MHLEVIHGAGNATAGRHRDVSVLLSVKNVAGLENGLYEVQQPHSWDTAPRRRSNGGVDEVALESPLSLTRARNSGEWYRWDIKLTEVPPSQARSRVSSFFRRTTGDGSVPGEFRRLGVSIVRGSNRDYRVILWGEDPDTDHWLRVGVVNVGRGTQSSLRTILRAVLLPFALAIAVGVIPLALVVLFCAVFLTTGRSVPMTLAALGVLFVAAYPIVRISEVRERADIHRALSPLVTAPLDSLRATAGREFQLTIPGDHQWRRIVRRMGPPSFLAVRQATERFRVHDPSVKPHVAVETELHHGRGWVGTWTASPQPASSPLPINGQTLRQIVRTSVGGNSVRIGLSNECGEEDVVVGAVRVAVSAGGAAIVEATNRVLRFNGSPTITISAGTFVVSDPVRLRVPALGDLAVSTYLPGNVAATTGHNLGLQTNYLSAPGDFTGTADFTGTTTQSYHFLTTVEVRARERAGAIVTLGESVTDGAGSTPDTNQRWTHLLAERLQGHSRTSDMAVRNAGIGGNRILHDIFGPSGLSRLDRDALVQRGATHLIVSPGSTDILLPDFDRTTRAERQR